MSVASESVNRAMKFGWVSQMRCNGRVNRFCKEGDGSIDGEGRCEDGERMGNVAQRLREKVFSSIQVFARRVNKLV